MIIQSLKGPLLDNQYQEITYFRKGGMGEIYTSYDITNNSKKAIKIVPIENEYEFQLLKTEFEISVQLKHKNIINTEYFDEFFAHDVKYIYSIMPFNEKGNLRNLLEKQTELISLNDSLKLMIDLTNGLEYAHQSIIHRDLKPENILVNDNLELQICDFGLAKLVNMKTRTKTFKGSGTMPYMAPECWMFDSNTIAMDIYSLGMIFYEILTLEMAFTGKTEFEIRNKHLYEPLPAISIIRKDIPIRLVEIINKMTNKRPQERYSSMKEVVEALMKISQDSEQKKQSKIESLADKANQKITKQEQIELIKQREQEQINLELNFFNFAKNNIFNDFTTIINELNENLERNKIYINKSSNSFTARFMDKSFSISFYPHSDISKWVETRKNKFIQNQVQQYGGVLQSFSATYIEKDNVLLIGKMNLNNHSRNSRPWGYNLILRKDNLDDFYGEWWVVWFNDSPLINKYPLDNHYAIEIPEFYQEYEFGRERVMHIRTMNMKRLKEEGMDIIIEKILE